ncbi:cytochrome P450 [Choanephora cucurbitarum]|nr:cytochrome P450 [Choanephora cucurbitarum]
MQSSIISMLNAYYPISESLRTLNGRKYMLSSAIAATVVYLVHDYLFKPPRELRHIPYVSWLPAFLSSFQGISTFDYNKKNIQPKMKSKKIKDIYVRLSEVGWTVYIANFSEAKRILMKPDLFPKVDLSKGLENTLRSKMNDKHSLFFSNGSLWKNQRALLGPALGRHLSVKKYAEITSILLNQINQLEDSADIKSLTRRYTLDAIAVAALGVDMNSTSDPNCEIVNTYAILDEGMQDPFHFYFPYFEQNHLWMFPKLAALHGKLDLFRSLIDEMISERKEELKKKKSNRYDLLTVMLEAQEEDGSMTEEQIKSNINFAFLTGYNGTANILCFALYYLAVNPNIQHRARQEVLSVLGDEPKGMHPTLEQIKRMRYIYAIIKEVLRMHPTAPRSIPRIIQNDIVVCDKLIPKGSFVAIDIFNMHHHDDTWPDEDVFDPERFEKAGNDDAGKGLSWLPFGGGSRQCIGMNLSLLILRICLCMLLSQHEWTLPEDSVHKNGLVTRGAFLVAPQDMRLKFKYLS